MGRSIHDLQWWSGIIGTKQDHKTWTMIVMAEMSRNKKMRTIFKNCSATTIILQFVIPCGHQLFWANRNLSKHEENWLYYCSSRLKMLFLSSVDDDGQIFCFSEFTHSPARHSFRQEIAANRMYYKNHFYGGGIHQLFLSQQQYF